MVRDKICLQAYLYHNKPIQPIIVMCNVLKCIKDYDIGPFTESGCLDFHEFLKLLDQVVGDEESNMREAFRVSQ